MRTSQHTPSQTWSEFVEALHAPVGHEFNAFYWLYRLFFAFLDTIIPCRNESRRKHLSRYASLLRPFIPSFGITLTLLCVGSYFTTFRQTAIIKKGRSETLHTSIVLWLALNILCHYFYCIYKSPGIVVTPKLESAAEPSNDVMKIGGCCFIKSAVNLRKEKKRSHVYNKQCKNYIMDVTTDENAILYHPTTNETHCSKCDANRPPRSHHCRICEVCVLEYDHHCPWINNCVGYNNYRNFLLLVFYVGLSCFYGCIMLVHDFYNMTREHIALHGFKILGAKYGTGLLDLPPPWTMLSDYRSRGKIDDDVVLRAIFPFLLFVSICMFIFLLDHLRNVARGYTTLERKTRPDRSDVVNPFENGPRNNIQHVFGKSLVKLFLPF